VRDLVATPVIGSTYGSDLHAQAVEIILSGAWLKRPGSMATVEFSLAVALAFLAIWLLPMRTPNRGVVWVAGGVLFVVAVSLGAFVGGRVLVDLIVPFLGGGGTAIGCLGALLVETDRHRRDLRETLAEARVREAKIDGELAAAKDIQLGMLPDTAAIASLPRHVDLSAFLEPARSIGGDLYDAFMLDDRRLYFMVGDVTGKGVPASLFMALAKALSKSVVLREGSDLEEAVMAANAEISRENTAEFFVTALFGVLDTTTGEVELCNAGHDNPLILRADGSIEVFEMDGGPPLCVFEEFPYPVEPITLAPGETLVIITDGVTEAKAPDDDLFGRERLLEVLGAERSGEIIDEVVSAVRAFEAGAEPTDDLTVMTIAFRGEDG
jgi:serine phosphatase RsbU (regulator of sigma subunit)